MFRRLALLATGLCACQQITTEADFTGARIYVISPTPIQIESLQLAGKVGAEDAFTPSPRTIPLRDDPNVPPVPFSKKVFSVVIDAKFVGGALALVGDAVDANGGIVATGSTQVSLGLGFLTTSTITLAGMSTCGNAFLDEGEACDDGNVMSGDGCAPRCSVETGFICGGRPSHCSPEATTALVDAAATCPGNGTAATPFCALTRAIEVPWPEVVIVRAGDYEERVEIDHDLRIEADQGAILSETIAPVLLISGGEVEVNGLSVQGGSRSIGGGIVVTGMTTQATLQRMNIGPGSAIGVEAGGGAFLELSESRIARHASGGLVLGSLLGFVVENNLIVENGSDRSAVGGAQIANAPVGSVFAFNTIAANLAETSSTAGLSCVDHGTPVGATLVWDNGTVTASIAASCAYDFSDLGPLAPGFTLTGTNFSADPDLDATYHLGPESGCVDRANPGAAVPAVDYDGQSRPRGPGPDVGADERG